MRDGRLLLGQLLDSALAAEEPLECRPGQRVYRRGFTIMSLFGPTTYTRPWRYDPVKKSGEAAFDQKLGLIRHYTGGLAKLMCRAAARDGYESAAGDLLAFSAVDVCGRQIQRVVGDLGPQAQRFMGQAPREAPEGPAIPILYIEADGTGAPVRKEETEDRLGKQPDGTSRTREVKVGCVFTQHHTDPETGRPWRDLDSTTYAATIEEAETFGTLLRNEARRRGLGLAQTVVYIGDGAEWVWRQAADKFPHAIEILDSYHAFEHLANLARMVKPADWKKLLERWKRQVLDNKLGTVLAYARRKGAAAGTEPADFERELGYFENNRARMRYKTFRQNGYFIGSGVVEAACKTVVGKRIKQSGMFWSVDGANHVLAFRSALLSSRFDQLWGQIRNAA